MLGGNPEFLAVAEVGSREAENYDEVLKKYEVQCKEEGEKVKSIGGLFILGTERHESRRIDNQLRGRAGRQGDPGESEFYLSLEDDLMRLFGSDRVKTVMEKLGLPEGEPITHPMINKAIANAQTKIESRNFGIRKNLLEYDDVMNKQRTAIYDSRNEAMAKEDLKDSIIKMLHEVIYSQVAKRFVGEYKEDWDMSGLAEYLRDNYGYIIEDMTEYKSMSIEDYSKKIFDAICAQYDEKESKVGRDLMRRLEKYILFEVIDARWREHLKALDGLKEGIYLRAYGQKNPVDQYRAEGSEMFEQMVDDIKTDVVKILLHLNKVTKVERTSNVKITSQGLEGVNTGTPQQAKPNTTVNHMPVKNDGPQVGRNDPCPCGSGKKYKNCCGK